jgi:hypothetical protein
MSIQLFLYYLQMYFRGAHDRRRAVVISCLPFLTAVPQEACNCSNQTLLLQGVKVSANDQRKTHLQKLLNDEH